MNAVEELAESQYGLVTRAQSIALGVSDSAISRRLRSGHWLRVHPGVFRIAGAPVTDRQRLLAATLWTGGVASHASSGRLLRIGALGGDGVHITLAHGNSRQCDHVVLHTTTTLPHIDRRTVDAIPCTSATRTLIDRAADLDDESFEAAFEAARRMGLTTLTLFERRAAELCGKGRPGSTRVRRLITVAGHRSLESRLEVKTARLLRASCLPPPVRQLALGRYRVDFAWPPRRFAVECDGFEYHGARLAWKRDRRRIAAIEAMGWRTMHVKWDDVTECPDETVDRIAYALRAAA